MNRVSILTKEKQSLINRLNNHKSLLEKAKSKYELKKNQLWNTTDKWKNKVYRFDFRQFIKYGVNKWLKWFYLYTLNI